MSVFDTGLEPCAAIFTLPRTGDGEMPRFFARFRFDFLPAILPPRSTSLRDSTGSVLTGIAVKRGFFGKPGRDPPRRWKCSGQLFRKHCPETLIPESTISPEFPETHTCSPRRVH